MSARTRTTYAKRQKEQARHDKQRAKAQRKLERKLENQQATEAESPEGSANETAPVSDAGSVSQMDWQ